MSSIPFDEADEIVADPSDDDEPWLRYCKAPGCGKRYFANRMDRAQQYCSRECQLAVSRPLTRNTVRDERRAKHDLAFIGIDGEGVKRFDDSGNVVGHDYVLLVAGGNGCEPMVLHKNGARLTTSDIFEWLYFTVFPRHPAACYVTFAMGYDLSQWVKNLPLNPAEKLFTKKGIASRKRTKSGNNRTPFPAYWRNPRRPSGEWDIDTLGSKRLKLRWCERPYHEGPAKLPEGEKGPPWMYVCDAFSFFQCSFLKAIDPTKSKHPVVTPEEFQIIKEGKARREDAVFDETMLKYCALEVEVLSRLMRQLNQGMVENDIRLKRTQFFGPGQTAQASLDNISAVIEEPTEETTKDGKPKIKKVYTLSAKYHQEIVPLSFRDAARQSYYGGWFEIFKHGLHEGTCYEYDINSAYPGVMTQLPCLLHGRYLSGEGNPYRTGRKLPPHIGFGLKRGQLLCLVEARVYGSNRRIGAMLHRIGRGPNKGSIIRPHETEGWFWAHELEAAQRAKLIDDIEYIQWRAYVPCDCDPPLRPLQALYVKRLEVGKNTPRGVALKLAYNSMYGKFAQSVGTPKYANPIFASLITAGCRCMILDAIATHQRGANAVLMVATDGIYFDEKHRLIKPHPETLGAWDMTERQNLTLFKPGCYWDDSIRTKIKNDNLEDLKLKARGVNVKALAREILHADDLFAAMKPGDNWPTVTIETPFQVVSPTQALARHKWNTVGAVSFNRPVKVSSDPTIKRSASGPGWSKPLALDITGRRSLPYKENFGQEDLASEFLRERPLLDFTHPDGDLITQLSGFLFGSEPDASII